MDQRNFEWRHAVGDNPAFLMNDGRMVGEWYPNGMLMLYIGQAPDEQSARTVLELLASCDDVGSSLASIATQVEYVVKGNE